ncbi:type IV pilus secretin PilQ/competence protein [Candidatus Magnetobacterium bavaricum]|uniref:Type IV pilus secretin PilQ/competence protein n=1 Tax=Candidatus Magnetobacterium bavaricum TaxID=29290 RepID=A0A0F3GWQ6_9BACT|nr:type IV pilus secretin PilQ/competence protein [Candidatus Magnetobacterium bavaricum]
MVYACASVNNDNRYPKATPYVQQETPSVQRETSPVQQSLNVLTEVIVEDFKVKLIATDVFPYNIINTSDPLKKIVELKGVEAGDYKDRLIVGREGIADVIVSEDKGPVAATVLEVRLESPLEIFELVSQNTLALAVKTAEEKVVATNGEIKEKTIVKLSNGMPKEAMFIKGVNFKKESAVRSRVEILGDGPIAPDVFPLDGRIVIDIPKVKLAVLTKQIARKPLSDIRWTEHKDKVRIVLDVAEKVNYEVVTGGNVVVIVLTASNVKQKVSKTAITVLPAKKKGGKGLSTTDDVMTDVQTRIDRLKKDGMKSPAEKENNNDAGFPRKGLVTLDFNNADIVHIMRLISDAGGYNMVVDPAVKGKITLKLKDVPWDKALELILDAHRLDKEMDGNILKIKPKDAGNGVARCSSQPVVIKDLTITLSNMGGTDRSVKRENIESGNGNIHLDLNINLDGKSIDDTNGDKKSVGEKDDISKKGNKR